MKSGSVFIITNQKEQEVDGVIDFLRDKGINIIRWNLCQFPEKESYTVSPLSLLFPKLISKTTYPSVGWVHHFGQFSIDKSLTGLEREVSLRETRSFAEGILSSLECSWLNRPSAVVRASNKIYQLISAARLKIPVPDFVISNDELQVKEFSSKYDSVILKSISTGFISYGDLSFKVYTKQFTEVPEDIFSGLKYGPVIVQQQIKKKKEFRITIVDKKCFSIEVDYKDIPEATDVRELIQKSNRHLFRRANNIREIEDISIELTHHFGLNYAGFDWILSTEGSYYFLELNPLGSFKWYEQCGSFNITEELGEALIRRIQDGQ